MNNAEFFEEIAETVGISVEDLLAAAQLNYSRGDTLYMGSNQNYEDLTQQQVAEFWERWMDHTGKTGEDDEDSDDYRGDVPGGGGRFFSCSC